MERFYSADFLTKLKNADSFTQEHQIKLAEIIIDNLCNINNFVGENGQSLTQYFDFLYTKPNQRIILFSPIIEYMIKNNFFQLMIKILRDANNYRFLDSDNPAREAFIIINQIIISYADFSIEFRKSSVISQLINSLVEIIDDSYNTVKNANNKCIECVNLTIRALYNVTRLNEMRMLFRKLKIPFILMSRINHINDEKTRVCAILCLGWTLNAEDIESHSVGELDLDFGLTISFSLLDRALQTGNSNDKKMFRCFLGQHNLLPCFWAYEICDGITKLGEIENVRKVISNRSELFKLLVEFYTKSISIQEKISASYAILVFSCETNFIEIVRKNASFRKLLLTDITQEELCANLALINHNLYFKVGLELELNLKSASEYELKFKELSVVLDNLIRTYTENEIIKLNYKNCQEAFLRDTFHTVEEMSDYDRFKVLLLNLILKKMKQHFDKELLRVYICKWTEVSSFENQISTKNFNYNSMQVSIEREIDLKQLIIICFILLEKTLLERNEDQENCICSEFSAYEISKKLGEWAENNSIKEFILMALQEKLELFLDLYNKSREINEKFSACYLITLFSGNNNFLNIVKEDKKFCSSLFKDLDKSNGMIDFLVEISYNLFDYTHIVRFVDQPSLNEIDNFNKKIKLFDQVLKHIEIKFVKNDDHQILEKIDELIEEVNQTSKNLAILYKEVEGDIFQIKTLLLKFSLLRIKKYLSSLKLKNHILSSMEFNNFALTVFNHFNDNYDETYFTLKKIFPNTDEFNKVLKYFESASEGSNCFLTKLLELLNSLIRF